MHVIRTGGKAFHHKVQQPRQTDAHRPADTAERDTLTQQMCNQGALLVRNDAVFGSGNKLAVTSFTLMILFAMAGRSRVLTPEEFQRMLNVSPDYFKPVLSCGSYTGMRREEILELTWDRVDLKAGFIRLRVTKVKDARHIPIGRELRKVLQRLPIALDPQGAQLPNVFMRRGKPIKSVREIFNRVRREVGLTDLVFHDMRHTATTNLRRAGVDALTAMKITGHKTMAVFKRYNTIDEDDLTAAQRQLDTYMDTKTLSPQQKQM